MAALTSSAIALILTALGLNESMFPDKANLNDVTTFDYIIVGGGTAGCVLASRLAELENSTVLLVERGEDPPLLSYLSGLFFLLPKTSIDYDYTSVFDDYAASGQGNYTRLTSGKGLGGSSILNHLLYARGVPSDYNYWAEVTGEEGWTYDNILPYFIKSETVDDEEVLNAYPTYHGTSGPLGITRQLHDDKVADYLTAFNEAGTPPVVDLNGDVYVGVAQPLLTIAKGLRQSPAYSYLNRVRNYSNLYVSRETVVNKIVIEDNAAVAVEAVHKDVSYILKARKEIILSAGVFNSPKILQLSGIGPKEHLEAVNIPVVADLPVGDNLLVPAGTVVVHKTDKHTFIFPAPSDLAGALTPTQIPVPLMMANIALNKSSNIPNHQSYNLFFGHDTPFLTLVCTTVYGFNTEICLNWQKETVRRDALYSVIVNLDTTSTGTVRLNTTDTSADPVIETGIYKNDEDLDNMVNNLMDFVKIGETPTFVGKDAAVVGVDFDECADKEYGTREFWSCYALHRGISPFLYMGTCPMGTVVDGQLKVKGIDNLRVVDASTFPKVLHGATNAAVIVLAEKAADLIKSSA
ncbi:ecdysone oxidase-like [Helicoverpa zea]|uniref:ecdysone oxidase-like n=1 Tax=Helicoverpa zea TaxID=7113 RepID=UPI001F570CDC|nr:ecdysone oxidase-like [Helicoverpa zea]